MTELVGSHRNVPRPVMLQVNAAEHTAVPLYKKLLDLNAPAGPVRNDSYFAANPSPDLEGAAHSQRKLHTRNCIRSCPEQNGRHDFIWPPVYPQFRSARALPLECSAQPGRCLHIPCAEIRYSDSEVA